MTIQVNGLTKRYGRFPAVENASFVVKQGEVFALLGPNGSGKTTTMKCIVGLSIPTEGRILVNGISALRFPEEIRRCVSYLPQRVAFPENLTAREVLRFYCQLRKMPLERAEELLDSAGLGQNAGRPLSEFSGGMVQRLGLAVVRLPDSPILILDEPTANLDPQGVKRFREFILQQKEDGKTIVFSTHLLHEAEQLADRVGIFVGGRLVAQESVESLQRAYLTHKNIEDTYLYYVEAHHAE